MPPSAPHKLAHKPATKVRVVIARVRYETVDCEGNADVITTAMPNEMLPGCMAAPSLLSHVVHENIGKGLPLFRIEDSLAREGFRIDRGTLSRWKKLVGDGLAPTVVKAMHDHALATAFCISTDATLALALARKHNDPTRLAVVRGDIKLLRKEKSPWIAAHARLLSACVESFGDRALAARQLREVEGQLEAVDMRLHAAVCCYRRGQLETGPEGAKLIAEAEARMRALGVARPEGFVRMLAPGFPSAPV